MITNQEVLDAYAALGGRAVQAKALQARLTQWNPSRNIDEIMDAINSTILTGRLINNSSGGLHKLRQIELMKKNQISPEWREYITKRLGDPAHNDDKGPPEVWGIYTNNLYAVICSEKQLPVGIVEVTQNTPPNPGWWIDNKFRKKGYGKAMVNRLAKLLADSSKVSEIGKIEYRGQCHVESKKLGDYLKERFTFYRGG